MDWDKFYEWLYKECKITIEQFNKYTYSDQRSRLYEDFEEYEKGLIGDTNTTKQSFVDSNGKIVTTVHATDNSLESLSKVLGDYKDKLNGKESN